RLNGQPDCLLYVELVWGQSSLPKLSVVYTDMLRCSTTELQLFPPAYTFASGTKTNTAKDPGKTEALSRRFGIIAALRDYGEKQRVGEKRKGHKGPLLDVGMGECGKVRLRDEILSVSGQWMVGVDIGSARISSEKTCGVLWRMTCNVFGEGVSSLSEKPCFTAFMF
uniref:Uncharacterized protein n=1 Tax=Podarcis muralis TaxID=64176 RepID=A0A670I0H2_PODMU